MNSSPLVPVRWKGLRDQRGLTLIELLVTALVATVLTGAILGVFLTTFRAFNTEGIRIQNQESARLGMNQMARYIRSATSSADHQASWSNAVASAEAQSIEFYCDINGSPPSEKVRYYLDTTNLRMQVSTPTWETSPSPHWVYPSYSEDGIIVQQAVRNNEAALFTYLKYDGNGALVSFSPSTSAERQLVAAIDIVMFVNEVPELTGSDIRLSTRVQLRQRYDGGLE